MQVARSSYYAWLNHVPSKRNIDDQGILDYVIQLEEAHNYIFGVNRLVMHVNDDTQYHVSNSKMRRIMRENNIVASIKTKRKPRKNRKEEIISKNLLLNEDYTHNFKPRYANKYWVTDCTELLYGINNQCKLRLSAIKDLYDHSIIAWMVDDTETAKLVTETFKLAIENEPGAVPEILHSDRGSGYVSGLFNTTLSAEGVLHSMSRPGEPGDNSSIESFWSHMKEEYFRFHTSNTKQELIDNIAEFMNWYNNERRQSTLKGMTPKEFRNHASKNIA